jgi:hypothetical protein
MCLHRCSSHSGPKAFQERIAPTNIRGDRQAAHQINGD